MKEQLHEGRRNNPMKPEHSAKDGGGAKYAYGTRRTVGKKNGTCNVEHTK